MPTDLLFVYGTLRSEFDNRHAQALRAAAEFVGPATVMGSLFRIAHYPGYRPEPAGTVYGELYRITDPAILAALDEYEGEDYQRVRADCGGRPVWIYCFRTQPAPERRIESGDFCRP